MHGFDIRSLGLVILSCAVGGCAAIPPTAAPALPPATSAAGAGGTTIVAIAPPAGPHGTIWDFLGVTKLCGELGAVANCGLNLLGTTFPGLADGLPMTSLTNPAAAASSNPAIAAAAAAKADANAAPQKAAALRYLGTLGCGGCYPEVEKALLAGLEDCTELVRFEAAQALSETSRNRCRYCTSNKCCSENIRKKLIEVATKQDDSGCYVEPSARVRRMARVALCNCSYDPIDGGDLAPTMLPTEGPSSEDAPPPKPDPSLAVVIHEFVPPQKTGETANSTGTMPKRATAAELITNAKASVTKPYDPSLKPADIIVNTSDSIAKPATPEKKDGLRSPIQRTPNGPRIRWERIAVSVYRFETKEDAIRAMEYLRRKTMGENVATHSDPNLQYVTTREVGWTRPQDIRSPDLSKILFELPLGQLSPVLEVGDTLLICRVLERSTSGSNLPVPSGNLPKPFGVLNADDKRIAD